MSADFPQDLGHALIQAIALIARVSDYESVATDLTQLWESGKIRYIPTLQDRGQANLLGSITLGPEPFEGSIVGLAETLVHEHFHLGQNPFLKTTSFWSGVVTRTNVMRRYEAPAYRAGVDFLLALARQFPSYQAEAQTEINAIRETFASEFGTQL